MLAEPHLRALIEDASGVGGVVMGEHDERTVGVEIASARDHVPGGLRPRGRAAYETRAVRDVIGDRDADHGCGGRRRFAQCSHQPGHTGHRAGAREAADQGRVAVEETLLLDRRHPAGLRQSSGDRAGGLLFAGRARQPFEWGQRLHDLAQRLRLCRPCRIPCRGCRFRHRCNIGSCLGRPLGAWPVRRARVDRDGGRGTFTRRCVRPSGNPCNISIRGALRQV